MEDESVKVPWCIALLGEGIGSDGFASLVREYRLTSDEADGADLYVRWYENAKEGISVVVKKNRIDGIQLFSSEHPDFCGFSGEVPFGLAFEWDRTRVHRQIGKPDVEIPSRLDAALSHGGLDHYYHDVYTLVVQYSAVSGRVEVLVFHFEEAGGRGSRAS